MMDSHIQMKLHKFLKRMHPKKSWKWINNKYFPQYDDERNYISKWTLVGPNNKIQLNKISRIPIRRQNMIKHKYSPYDTTKSEYFINRSRKQFNQR